MEECKLYVTLITYNTVWHALHSNYIKIKSKQNYHCCKMCIRDSYISFNLYIIYALLHNFYVLLLNLESNLHLFVGVVLYIYRFQFIKTVPASDAPIVKLIFNTFNIFKSQNINLPLTLKSSLSPELRHTCLLYTSRCV